MAEEPPYEDEVHVALKPTGPAANHESQERLILLNRSTTKVDIGRSTKRDDRLTAGPNNGWFDSAVMSRKHARLVFSPVSKTVTLTDIGSLHGTFVNHSRLDANKPCKLATNDVLQFGLPVQRGSETYHACEMKIHLKRALSNSQHRPVIFRVPDSTDDEEDEPSDVDDALGASVAILQQAGIRARTEVSPGWEAAIDLTSDDGLRDASSRGNNAGEDEIIDEPSTRRHTDSDELVEAEDFDRSKPSWHSFSPPSDVPPSDFSSEDSSVDGQEEGANVDICEHASSLLLHSDDEDRAIRYISEDESFSDDEDSVFEDNVAEESQGAGQEDISESRQVVNVSATPVTYSEKGGEGSLFVPQLPDEESNVLPVPAAIDSSATVTLEAISPAFRSSQTEHDTPEDRGSWSSKAEFFAAWDHNRRKLAMMDPSPGDHHPKMDAEGDSDGDDVLPRSTILFSNAGLRDCTGTSDLLQSGEKFLESPMADLTSKSTCCFTPYDPSQPTADTLDYTSAYTYEVSKRLLESKNPPRASLEVSRATAERDAEVEVFSDQQSAVKTSSSKRKIADISDLVPKDTPRHHSEGESALVVGETEAVLALDTAPGYIASQASEHEVAYRRPTKRLRRAAEIVGFAALGGAAVMTALIATAPVL